MKYGKTSIQRLIIVAVACLYGLLATFNFTLSLNGLRLVYAKYLIINDLVLVG